MQIDLGVKERARGKWRGILSSLGVPARFLSGVHGWCPLCNGGKDRFRFTDKDGDGMYICNQCGAGDGFAFLQKYHGWDFRRTVTEVEAVIGSVREAAPPKPKCDYRPSLRKLYQESAPMAVGDLSHRYLTARLGTDVPSAVLQSGALRTHPGLMTEGVTYPCMLAIVSDRSGKAVAMQRTWIDGDRKAPVDVPRKTLGVLPPGSAVRLSGDPSHELGVAEGIETAIAASIIHSLTPIWAVLSAGAMERFDPPTGTKILNIHGDNDTNFVGQLAAYKLAARLHKSEIDARVRLPYLVGEDWCDNLNPQGSEA